MCWKEERAPAGDRCYAGLSPRVYLGVEGLLGQPLPQLAFSGSQTVAPKQLFPASPQTISLSSSCSFPAQSCWGEGRVRGGGRGERAGTLDQGGKKGRGTLHPFGVRSSSPAGFTYHLTVGILAEPGGQLDSPHENKEESQGH